jgi:hypothetical protein
MMLFVDERVGVRRGFVDERHSANASTRAASTLLSRICSTTFCWTGR